MTSEPAKAAIELPKVGFLQEHLPGLVLAACVGLSGKLIAGLVPGLGSVTCAVLLGIAVGNALRLGGRFGPGVRLAEKKVLETAIVLLGFGLEMTALVQLGSHTMGAIAVLVVGTVVVGTFMGRLVGLSRPFSLLLAVGSAICGSSAIAVVAPLVVRNEEDIGLSVSVVNLVGAVGLFALPALASFWALSATQSGLLIGASLPAVGHVVAAGFCAGQEVGELSTIIKMARILLLGPMVLALAWLYRANVPSPSRRFPLPLFIVGFFVTSAIGSAGLLPRGAIDGLKDSAGVLLAIAMAAIGLRISLRSLLRQGPKAVAVAAGILGLQVVALWAMAQAL